MSNSFGRSRRTRVALFSLLAAAAIAIAPTPAAAAASDTPSWSSLGPLGGNVYCIAADPAHSGTLYAGTQRGIFKSLDGGASWAPAGTGLAPTTVQTIVIDPSSPSTLYAGTLTSTGLASVGIFKSSDAGATWMAIDDGLFDPVTGVGPVDVESMAIDPGNPSVLIAGTLFSEIFRSIDGGATWQPVTLGGNSVGLETTAVVFDPATPSNVYAATNLGFFRSTNNGQTWVQAGDAGVPFYALAIDSTTPQTLYAADATGSGIWKSTNGGSHWATVSATLPGTFSSRPPVIALTLDPANPGTIYAGTYGDGVFVTRNAGTAWTSAATGMRDTRIAAIAIDPEKSSTLYAASLGGGVYESVDAAANWTMRDGGLAATLVYGIVPDPAAAGALFASTSDGVFHTADAGETWQESDSGLPPETVSALVLVPGSSEKLLAGSLGAGIFQSSDRGATWAASSQGLGDPFISAITVDPTSPSTLYAGTAHPYDGSSSERIFKSTDGGASWAQTALDAAGFSLNFIAVNPARPAQVLAGSLGVSGLFQSLDAGKSWSTLAVNPSCGGLNALAFGTTVSTIYAAATAGVCRTTDGGTTWTIASAGGLAIDSILLDPSNPSTIYAGAAPDLGSGLGGVFVSTDGGQSFAAFGVNFPPGAVDSLVLDPSTGILYAGTLGADVAALFPSESRAAVVGGPARPGTTRTRRIDPR